jgi:hypothetical protein
MKQPDSCFSTATYIGKTMLTLTISHNVFLNEKQRYDLHRGEPVEVIGASVPVWFHKGNTSEPAKEVFCLYRLTNDKFFRPIMQTTNGYHISLPQKPDAHKMTTSINLLNIKDGGSEWLYFTQSNIIQGKKKFTTIHFIEIKPIEKLLKTLT